jgi:hypothetical protein
MRTRKSRNGNEKVRIQIHTFGEQLELAARNHTSKVKVESFLNGEVKMKYSGRKIKSLESYALEAKIRSRSGDWDGCTPEVFIGLYVYCYRYVYGSFPSQLKDRCKLYGIIKIVSKLFRTRFDNNHSEFVEYIKWTWLKEKSVLNWSIANGYSKKPMSPYKQFGDHTVDAYRINKSNGMKRG